MPVTIAYRLVCVKNSVAVLVNPEPLARARHDSHERQLRARAGRRN